MTVQIEQAGAIVKPLFTGLAPAGPSQILWDGDAHRPAAAGTYDAVVLVDGPFGRTRHARRSRSRADRR